jgi:uncharacterized protein YbjT (DUF2867 family)
MPTHSPIPERGRQDAACIATLCSRTRDTAASSADEGCRSEWGAGRAELPLRLHEHHDLGARRRRLHDRARLRVLQISNSPTALELVEAARQAGVERFVYVSFPEFDVEFPLQDAKRLVEQRLRESGLEFTILRPVHFMEVWLSARVGFDPVGGQVQVFGSGEKTVSWITFRDVAAFAVEALTNPAARNAAVDLGGPEAISPLAAVRVFEEETGRPRSVTHVPEEALDAQRATGADSLEQSFAGLMLVTAREGAAVDMETVLRDFPVELTSLRDYARALVPA